VITHQELLAAMSYKSNRNWTMPPLQLSLDNPYIDNTTGLCQSDKTYLVTYVMSANTTYSSASTFSYRKFLHCTDIKRIDGIEGGPHILNASLQNNHLPYLRSTSNITSFSGTGWNANAFNILIKEVDKATFSGINQVPHTGWKQLSGGGAYVLPGGETTISASGLTSYQFIMTRSDYLSAPDYSLDAIDADLSDRSSEGLSYGDEVFFHGNIEYDLVKDPEKVSIKFAMLPNRFNSTNNDTFGPNNEDVFVTGIYIMDDLNRVIAVAKPSRPIRKNYSRYVEFQLDLIF